MNYHIEYKKIKLLFLLVCLGVNSIVKPSENVFQNFSTQSTVPLNSTIQTTLLVLVSAGLGALVYSYFADKSASNLAKIQTLKAENNELQKNIYRLEDENKQLTVSSKNNINKIEITMHMKDKHMSTLSQENDKQKQEIQQLKNTIASLQSNNNLLDSEMKN